MSYSTLTLKSGWKINYWESGPVSAPVILFIHGLSGSCEYWISTVNSREMREYRCVAIDLLGFGYSDKPRGFDYSMLAQAGIIQDFLAQKKINKVVYVGHSMGGVVGMALLKSYPGTLQKIVLVDSTLNVENLPGLVLRVHTMPEWCFYFVFPLLILQSRKIAASIFFERPTNELRNMATRLAEQATPYSLIRTMKTHMFFVNNNDLLSSFKSTAVPHYFIYGATDLRVANMVENNFVDKKWVYKVPGVKHCPMLEATEDFSAILADILKKRVNDAADKSQLGR